MTTERETELSGDLARSVLERLPPESTTMESSSGASRFADDDIGPTDTRGYDTTTTTADVPSNITSSTGGAGISDRNEISTRAGAGSKDSVFGKLEGDNTNPSDTTRRRSSLARDHGFDPAEAGTMGTTFLHSAGEEPAPGHSGVTTSAGTYLGPGPSAKGMLGKLEDGVKPASDYPANTGRRSSLARDHGVDTASAGTTGTTFLPHADEEPTPGHSGVTTSGGTYLGPGPSAKGWLGKLEDGVKPESDYPANTGRRSSLARDHGVDTASAGTTGTSFLKETEDPETGHAVTTSGGTNIGPGPSTSGMFGKLESLVDKVTHRRPSGSA